MRFVLVGIGGAVGSVLRYGIGLALAGTQFPWATLSINLTGSFAIGLVFTAFLGRWPDTVTTAVTVGVIGGFTTFSTFAWETFSAAQAGRGWMSTGYVAASVAGGLIAAWLGFVTGRALAG